MLKDFFQFKLLHLALEPGSILRNWKKKKSFWLGFQRSNGKCSSELYSKPSQITKMECFRKYLQKKLRFRDLNGFWIRLWYFTVTFHVNEPWISEIAWWYCIVCRFSDSLKQIYIDKLNLYHLLEMKLCLF